MADEEKPRKELLSKGADDKNKKVHKKKQGESKEKEKGKEGDTAAAPTQAGDPRNNDDIQGRGNDEVTILQSLKYPTVTDGTLKDDTIPTVGVSSTSSSAGASQNAQKNQKKKKEKEKEKENDKSVNNAENTGKVGYMKLVKNNKDYLNLADALSEVLDEAQRSEGLDGEDKLTKDSVVETPIKSDFKDAAKAFFKKHRAEMRAARKVVDRESKTDSDQEGDCYRNESNHPMMLRDDAKSKVRSDLIPALEVDIEKRQKDLEKRKRDIEKRQLLLDVLREKEKEVKDESSSAGAAKGDRDGLENDDGKGTDDGHGDGSGGTNRKDGDGANASSQGVGGKKGKR